MRNIILLFLLFLFSCSVGAQVHFRTIAPQVAVVTGESFEIQYLVEGEENIETFTAPAFTGFRYVTGPHVYKGSVIDLNISRPLINTVYTLAAVKPGKYFLPGAKAIINGSPINSNDVFIQVISKEEAARQNRRSDGSFYKNSEYFLRPGEDPIEKINKNLFVKVMVSKQSCYVGEPIVATFKLYSRLESKSDIVKNPGFYGFAVHDMINLADRAQTTETIHGKTFDVHTIRRVQLYPLRSGSFMIDPMEISNKVEFSRSEVNKKTEQEIVEGVLKNNTINEIHNNTEVYENDVKTDAVPVVVKALPAKNKTDSFTAAVGTFSITAELEKNSLAKNEQGNLVISVTGKGNFTQITAPDIKWPAGIDGFEPQTKDSIDRLQVPLAGTKVFRYAFVSAKPGDYEVAPIEFSFFNLDTNKFETVTTKPLKVAVSNKERVKEKFAIIKNRVKNYPFAYWWIAAGAFVVLLMISAFIFTRRKKKQQAVIINAANDLEEKPSLLSVDELLLPAQMMLSGDDKRFYSELNKAIWAFFNQHMNLSGSEMSKPVLVGLLRSLNINGTTITTLLSVLQQCETGMYTDAVITDDKQQLLDETKQMLKEINEGIRN